MGRPEEEFLNKAHAYNESVRSRPLGTLESGGYYKGENALSSQNVRDALTELSEKIKEKTDQISERRGRH